MFHLAAQWGQLTTCMYWMTRFISPFAVSTVLSSLWYCWAGEASTEGLLCFSCYAAAPAPQYLKIRVGICAGLQFLPAKQVRTARPVLHNKNLRVCVCEHAHTRLQPCVFVSSQHSLCVLLRRVGWCFVRGWFVCVAFLFHTDPSIYLSSFCRQC